MTSTDQIQPPEVKGTVSFEAQTYDDRLDTPSLDIRQVPENLNIHFYFMIIIIEII